MLLQVRRIKLDDVHQHLEKRLGDACLHNSRNPLQHKRADALLKVLNVFAIIGQRPQQLQTMRYVLGHLVVLDDTKEVSAHYRQALVLALDQLLVEDEGRLSLFSWFVRHD